MPALFKETECVARIDHGYVSIQLSDGVREKGIHFVSDGIIYWSPIVGNEAGDYGDVSRLNYVASTNESTGLLSIDYVDRSRPSETVGVIKYECWLSLKELMRSNNATKNIQIEESRGEVN